MHHVTRIKWYRKNKFKQVFTFSTVYTSDYDDTVPIASSAMPSNGWPTDRVKPHLVNRRLCAPFGASAASSSTDLELNIDDSQRESNRCCCSSAYIHVCIGCRRLGSWSERHSRVFASFAVQSFRLISNMVASQPRRAELNAPRKLPLSCRMLLQRWGQCDDDVLQMCSDDCVADPDLTEFCARRVCGVSLLMKTGIAHHY